MQRYSAWWMRCWWALCLLGSWWGCSAYSAPAPSNTPMVVAGQTVGKTTLTAFQRYSKRQFKSSPTQEAPYSDSGLSNAQMWTVATVTVAPRITARLEAYFDEAQVLQAMALYPSNADDAQTLYGRLTQGSKDVAPVQGDVFTAQKTRARGGVTARLLLSDKASRPARLLFTSPAYEARVAAHIAQQQQEHALLWQRLKVWGGAAASIAVAMLLWRARGTLRIQLRSAGSWLFLHFFGSWPRFADWVLALPVALALLWWCAPHAWQVLAAPHGSGWPWRFLQQWPAWAMLLGYWTCCYNACTLVRLNGWLFDGRALWHSPAALVLTPALLAPVALRNAVRSPHFLGLALLHAQAVALWLYYWGLGSWVALPLLGLLAGGITRLFSVGCNWGTEKTGRLWLGVLIAQLIWPVLVLLFVLQWLWQLLQSLLMLVLNVVMLGLLMLRWFIIVVPVGFLLYWMLGEWSTTVMYSAGLLILLVLSAMAVLPALLGLAAVTVLPTGYANLDFSTPTFNPTTGLPMLDGMGSIDSAGNIWGGGFGMDFNPATGLPMLDGIGGFDVGGNAFGMDFGGGLNDPFQHH